VMFLHCVSDLALLCRLNTKDLLEKVLSDPLQGGFSLSPSKVMLNKLIGLTTLGLLSTLVSAWYSLCVVTVSSGYRGVLNKLVERMFCCPVSSIVVLAKGPR
jgi:hypothetical protein